MACGSPLCLGDPTNQNLRSRAWLAHPGITIATALGDAIRRRPTMATDSSPRLLVALVRPSVPLCLREGALATVSTLPRPPLSVHLPLICLWSGCGVVTDATAPLRSLGRLLQAAGLPRQAGLPSRPCPRGPDVTRHARARSAHKPSPGSDLSRCRPPAKQPPTTQPLTRFRTAHLQSQRLHVVDAGSPHTRLARFFRPT